VDDFTRRHLHRRFARFHSLLILTNNHPFEADFCQPNLSSNMQALRRRAGHRFAPAGLLCSQLPSYEAALTLKEPGRDFLVDHIPARSLQFQEFRLRVLP
jgi:hypothetical protein